MDKSLTPEEVMVTRWGPPERATTLHDVFADKRNAEGKVIGQGDYLGTAVMLAEKKQVVYAQRHQMEPV